MTYVDGFIAAVPKAKKEDFIEHARKAAGIFKEYGAVEICECWEDDVPEGEVTSFPLAVKRQADEAIAFSWVIWPSKDLRDKSWEALMNDDNNPMPFDGKRMIYGGFQRIVNIT